MNPRSCRLGVGFWTTAPLVLTATIHVAKGLTDSPLSDAAQRERDYLDCLRFYLAQPHVEQVVFAENSGADLRQFRQLACPPSKRLELVPLDENRFPPEFGKGYGEARLLDAVLANSELLKDAPAFMKATGRITLRNVGALIAATDPACAGHFDVRDHDWYDRLGLHASSHHADTRFFVVTRALFSAHLQRLHEAHTSGTFSIEANYLKAIRAAQAEGYLIRDRFALEPIYSGTAGHGKDYDAWPERTKRWVRGLTRRWLPALKI